VSALNQHPLSEKDFVIRVIKPPHTQLGMKEFGNREEADVAYDTDKSL